MRRLLATIAKVPRRLALSALVAVAPATAAHADVPRVTSVQYQTFIWPRPDARGRFLGTLRVGHSVALRERDIVAGQGCPGGFYAIEPRGFVCQDRTVTASESTPFLQNNAITLPRAGAFPYEFALSNGAPMYARVPTAGESARLEARYGHVDRPPRLAATLASHEHLATSLPIAPDMPVPGFVARGMTAREVRPLQLFVRTLPHGSMLSYAGAFEAEGRTWLLSTDLTIVPADRVRRFQRSQFRGVTLGSGVELPLAWFRGAARPAYRRECDGTLTAHGESFQPRTFVALTGARAKDEGRVLLETKARLPATGGSCERALWIDERDASVAEAVKARPFGVAAGEKWLAVSISRGILIAYEDLEPVFTTLVSPGRGGIPRRGGNNVSDATTPLGRYRITYKDRASTMASVLGEERSSFISDVPFTQYFSAPFALHATYWHELLGEPVSAGCVNASPLDASWLFEWTDPPVPAGWHGATGAGAPENGGATAVVVTR